MPHLNLEDYSENLRFQLKNQFEKNFKSLKNISKCDMSIKTHKMLTTILHSDISIDKKSTTVFFCPN